MANRSQFVQNKLLTHLLGTISHAFWHTQRFQVGLANNNPWHHKNVEDFCTRIMETYISAIILFGQIYIYNYIYISHMIWSWKLPGPFKPRIWCHGFPRVLWQTKKSPGKPDKYHPQMLDFPWQFCQLLRGPPSVSQPIGGRRLIRYSPGHTCCCWKRDITAAYLQNESFSSRNRQSSSYATRIHQEMSETFTFGFTMHHRLGASNKKLIFVSWTFHLNVWW